MEFLGSICLTLCVTLASEPGVARAGPTPQDAPTFAAIGVDELLAALRGGKLDEQLRVMQSFARQASAPTAIPRLLQTMREEAPELDNLDNEVGLVVGFILESHPTAPCDIEPLLEAIRRPRWTSQQKCAQALVHLLRRGDGKDRAEELVRCLVPLLASQRPRVFDAGEACLIAFTGEQLGDVPDRWLAWYERTFGRPLDMHAAVHEDLVVIELLMEGERTTFGVEGAVLATHAELRALVLERQQAARERELALAVAIQLPDERLTELDAVLARPEVSALVALLLKELGIGDVVISPASDAFRAPWRPAR